MNSTAPLLLCYDGSDDAKVAVQRAGALFGHRDAIVLSVWQRTHATSTFVMPGFTYTADVSAVDETAENVAAALAAEGADLAAQAGLNARPVHACASGPIAETMLNVAGEHRVAAIVLGSRGRGGIKSMLLGSVSNHVVHHTTRPTFVVRHDAPETHTDAPIALCYDGSSDAKLALERAGELFGDRRAVVLAAWQTAHALPGYGLEGAAYIPDFEQIEQAAEKAAGVTAAEGCERAQAAGLASESRVVRASGTLWPALMAAAEQDDAVAIVLGSRGLRGAKSLLIGSVSNSVLHHTKRPVLVVRSS